MKQLVRFLWLIPSIVLAQETPKLATEGRIWLKIPRSQLPLTEVQVSSGTANPAPWEQDSAVRERTTELTFPISWWEWRELTISFTPMESGTVELVLTGPWEQERPGRQYRKEVLWDSLTADGTTVANGGFESTVAGTPEHWNPLYQEYPNLNEWPLKDLKAFAGNACGAAWQDRPLSQNLTLTAGRKVTLRLHAKAATLPGFVPPRRLGQDTPAHRKLAKIKRGVNLGNCWEAPPPYTWGIRYTVDDIDRIASEGFDHIRVPVAWAYHLKPSDGGLRIDPTLLADLEPVLRRALDKGLHVLLDWHHFHELTTAPAAHRARFVTAWQAIAQHFKSWPPELFFELLNEPRDALTTEVANSLYAETLAAIRKIDRERIVFLSPGRWGDIRELENLVLPNDDDRLVVTVHCYEPFFFTHQGADWVQLRGLRGITYPGPPSTPVTVPPSLQGNSELQNFIKGYHQLAADRNPCSAKPVSQLLELARSWSLHFGRPIHLGEFGSHHLGDQASRNRYTKDVRTLAEARTIPWTLWDWKAAFAYWNSETDQPYLRSGVFD